MHRIHTEFGLGRYRQVRSERKEGENQWIKVEAGPDDFVEGDELTLRRSDLAELEEYRAVLKEEDEESPFFWMIEAICDFMKARPEQDVFVFDGEF